MNPPLWKTDQERTVPRKKLRAALRDYYRFKHLGANMRMAAEWNGIKPGTLRQFKRAQEQ